MIEPKSILKTKDFWVHQVEYYDIDNFVKQVYGYDFSIAASEELKNDSQKTFLVKKEELDEYEKETIEVFMKCGEDHGFMTGVLLNDLCNKGFIEPGEYLVNVSW